MWEAIIEMARQEEEEEELEKAEEQKSETQMVTFGVDALRVVLDNPQVCSPQLMYIAYVS